MTTVRFASLCDDCNMRSEEYTRWNNCRDCGHDICPSCAVPGTLKEVDRDWEGEEGIEAIHYETVLCKACQKVGEAE